MAKSRKKTNQRKAAEPIDVTQHDEWSGLSKLWFAIAFCVGVMIPLAFLAPVDSVSVFLGSALPQNLGWLAIGGFVSIAAALSGRRLLAGRVSVWVVLIGFAWLVGVTCIAAQHGNARAVWNGFWQVVMLGACFLCLRSLAAFEKVRSALVLLLIVACTALSLTGLEQVLISLPANRMAYAENPDRMLAEQGIDAPPNSPRRKQFEDRLNSPEPFATFALANSLATVLSLGVVVSVARLLSTFDWRISSPDNASQRSVVNKSSAAVWFARVALVSVAGLQLVCLILTRSRTAFLALIAATAAGLLLGLLNGKVTISRRVAYSVGGAVMVLVIGGLGWLLTVDQLVWSEAPKSLSYRLEYWQATLAMIRDHAWTGVGLGNFQAYYPQYKLEQASEIIADPHNWFLDIAATLSLPIALAITAWLGYWVLQGVISSLTRPSIANVSSEANGKADYLELLEGSLVVWLFLGAAVGGACEIFFLSFIGTLELRTTFLVWGAASTVGVFIWGGASRELSPAAWTAAVLVVLVGLVASGSWQASGIAVPFLIVMATGTTATADGKSVLGQSLRGVNAIEDAGQRAAGRLLWLESGVMVLTMVFFVLQTWRPITQGWMWAERASVATTAASQFEAIDEAVRADPLDADRRLQRAQVRAMLVGQIQDRQKFETEAQALLAELVALVPADSVNYLFARIAGQIASDLAATAKGRGVPAEEYLRVAHGFYRQAAERYPSSVELQVQQALAASLIGEWKVVKECVDRAMAMSERTPHADKKLDAQLVWVSMPPERWESQTGNVPAEPLAEWLRKQAEAHVGRRVE